MWTSCDLNHKRGDGASQSRRFNLHLYIWVTKAQSSVWAGLLRCIILSTCGSILCVCICVWKPKWQSVRCSAEMSLCCSADGALTARCPFWWTHLGSPRLSVTVAVSSWITSEPRREVQFEAKLLISPLPLILYYLLFSTCQVQPVCNLSRVISIHHFCLVTQFLLNP